MLSLCKKNKKINLLHHSSLYQDKGHLVVAFCIVWCFLGAIRHCWRGSFRVIGILYGKKKMQGLESSSLVYFLDNMERKWNRRSFDNKEQLDQDLKNSFLVIFSHG